MKKTAIITFSVLVLLVSIFIINKFVNSSTHKVIDLDEIVEIENFNYEDTISSNVMKADFDFLVEKILEVHPDPKRTLGEKWDQLIRETEKEFDQPMSVGEFALKLMSFTTQLNDAHTEVYPVNIESKQLLPVNFEWVKEGLVISKTYEDLLEIGDVVIKIGNTSTDEIFRFMDKVVSAENEYWVKEKGKNFLRRDIFLKYLSVINDDIVSITVERDNKSYVIDVPLVSKEELQSNIVNEEQPWFSWDIRGDLNIGYFNIKESRISDEYDKEVSAFFEEVNQQNIDKVVIDLRSNFGGTTEVMDPFLKHLLIETIEPFSRSVKYSEEASKQMGYPQTTGLETFLSQYTHNLTYHPIYKGELYILTSPRSFSAGSWFAVVFHDSNLATIVGEPTGSSPSLFGATMQLNLPYTKFALFISHKEFRRPDVSLHSENTLYPDILVEETRADIVSGEDGQLERILKMISDTNN